MPQDWIDNAEFIWSLPSLGETQAEIAEIMRWSRKGVKNYYALKNISPDAWQIIVGTTKATSCQPGKTTLYQRLVRPYHVRRSLASGHCQGKGYIRGTRRKRGRGIICHGRGT